MFKRFLILGALAGIGGYFFMSRYDVTGWEGLKIVPKDDSQVSSASFGDGWDKAPAVTRTGSTVKIASFNLEVFGKTKMAKSHVMQRLALIVQQFDIVAVQEVQAGNPDLLPRFIEEINQSGRHYDYVASEPVGKNKTEHLAIIFDRASVEVDRSQLYAVNEPDDLLAVEPFVAWFRVRGPDEKQAFTFSLVNLHVSPGAVRQELDLLDDVMREVLNDGRNEDDVVVAGDFGLTPLRIEQAVHVEGTKWAILQKMLPSWQNLLTDNIAFFGASTVESTGKAGVFDFLRQFNLTTAEANEVSSHLPVWAEFSIYEGGKPAVTL